MRRLVRRAVGLAWLPLLVLCAGCSPDSQTIARVGNRSIQAEDLLATARALAARGALPPDSAKAKLLNAMIQRELLVLGAQHMGLHQDTSFMAFREKSEHDLLRERMLSELLSGPIEVSESEIEQLHRWREQESHARVVFTPSREAAEAAMAELHAGIAFALVANRFNPAGFTPPGGDIGFVAPGFLQPPLDDVVRTAVPGRLYGPIEAPTQGWFVVQVEERRPRKAEPLETERGMLTEVIRQRKQLMSVVRAVDRLKQEYDVRLLPGVSQDLMSRALQSVADSSGRLPPIGLGEKAAALVTYRGGSYTLGDAYDDLQTGAVARPNFHSLAAVDHWLESRAIDRVVLAEGRTRRFEDDPAFQRALRERLNDFLIQNYYAKMILTPVQATDEQAAAFYVREPQAGGSVGMAKVLMVTLPDSTQAKRLMGAAAHATGLQEAMTAAKLAAPLDTRTIQFPTPDPLWTALEPFLRGLEVGGFAGPFGLPNGWLVLQLVDRTQAAPPFATLPENTRLALRAQATDELRRERLLAVTDSLRHEYHVTVYTKRLDRLTLPEPTTTLGALTGP